MLLNSPSDRQVKLFADAKAAAFIDLEGEAVEYVQCCEGTSIRGSQFKCLPLYPRISFYPRQIPEVPDPVSTITRAYIIWLRDERYILFQNIKTGEIFSLPAAKRGNSVYANRVRDRFDVLKFALPNQTYFDPDFSHRGARSTPLLFVTLTYNPNRCSLDEAWTNLPKDYNRWMSRLRKEFPTAKIGALRGNEAHKSGYPHIHAQIAFSKALPVKRHTNRGGTNTWRIPYGLKEKIARCWSHGYVDVVAMHNSTTAISYIAKYVTKGLVVPVDSVEDPGFDNKALTALSIQWAKGMRAFSFSKLFISNLNGRLERILHNSNPKYRYIGTFPPCFKECIAQRGKIPEECPFLHFDAMKKPPPAAPLSTIQDVL